MTGSSSRTILNGDRGSRSIVAHSWLRSCLCKDNGHIRKRLTLNGLPNEIMSVLVELALLNTITVSDGLVRKLSSV